jgi:hypothetical protein
MQTITTRITDGMYESITREAARRSVSVDQVIRDWLLEGEESSPLSSEEPDSFDARIDHHMAEARALSEWHECLRPCQTN